MTGAIPAMSRLRPWVAAILLGTACAFVSAPALTRGPDGIADVAEKVIDAWCALGVRIHFYKDLTGEHVMGAGTAVPSQYLFLLSRFDNLPVAVVPPGTTSCN